MKKLILTAMAVGALAVGGIAKADVIDSLGRAISSITGVPYDARAEVAVPIVNGVYTDAYGRRYEMDAAGTRIALDQFGSYRDQWGRTVYLGANNQPVYIEQNGRLIAYGTVETPYALAPSYDSDYDDIPDRYDRYPYDSRYH